MYQSNCCRVDPVSLTWVLITLMILAFSGELGYVFVAAHDRDCYKENQYLLLNNLQGPLRSCER